MTDLAQSRLGQIAIVCLRFLFTAGPTLSFFDCGGVRLILSPAAGEADGTSVLYYFITDIEGSTRLLGSLISREPA